MPITITIDVDNVPAAAGVDWQVLMRLTVHWDAAASKTAPDEVERLLLQPWRWMSTKWGAIDAATAFTPAQAGAPDNLIDCQDLSPQYDPAQPATGPDPAALFDHLFDLHAQSTATAVFAYGARVDVAENPDSPDHLFWPETLAQIAHWPGMAPYRARVCWWLKGTGPALGQTFVLPRSITVPTTAAGAVVEVVPKAMPVVDPVADKDVRTATYTNGVTVRCLGTRAGAASDPAFDFDKLLVKPGAAPTGQDWHGQLPRTIAAALSPASLVPAILAWGDGNLNPQTEPIHRGILVLCARRCWAAWLGAMAMVAADGNPGGFGWIHELALAQAMVDAGMMDANVVAAAGRLVALKEFRTAITTRPAPADIDELKSPCKWPDAAQAWPSLRAAVIDAVAANSTDAVVMGFALDLVAKRLPHDAGGASDIGILRAWVAKTQATGAPPPASRHLSMAWAMDLDWRKYLDAVAAAHVAAAGCDAFPAHRDKLTVIAEAVRKAVDPDPPPTPPPVAVPIPVGIPVPVPAVPVPAVRVPASVALGVLTKAVDTLRPVRLDDDQREFIDVDEDLVVQAAAPSPPVADGRDDPLSRIGGLVGFIRQVPAQPAAGVPLDLADRDWHPLNLARVTAQVTATGASIDLGDCLVPAPIAYVQGQRRVMASFNGDVWVTDERNQETLTGSGGGSDPAMLHYGIDLRAVCPVDLPVPTMKYGVPFDMVLMLAGTGNRNAPVLRALDPGGHPAMVARTNLESPAFAAALAGLGAYTFGGTVYRARRVASPVLKPGDGEWHDANRGIAPWCGEWLKQRENPDCPDPFLRKAPIMVIAPMNVGLSGPDQAALDLTAPQVGIATWLRWHDRTKLDIQTRIADPANRNLEIGKLEERILQGRAHVNRLMEGKKDLEPGFDDPAVVGFAIAVGTLWPLAAADAVEWKTFDVDAVDAYATCPPDATPERIGACAAHPCQGMRIVVTAGVDTKISMTVTQDATIVNITLPAGAAGLIEVRARVDSRYFAGDDRRFIKLNLGPTFDAINDLQRRADGIAFAPFRFVVEVATGALPSAADLLTALNPNFARDLVTVDVATSAPKFAYADRLTVTSQQWGWRGLPHDEYDGDPAKLQTWSDRLFAGRDDDDGIRTTAVSAANGKPTRVLARSRAGDGRAELWRFSLTAASRYKAWAMGSLETASRVVKIVDGRKVERIHTSPLLVPLRGAKPLPAPKLRICLPLLRTVPPAPGAAVDQYRLAFAIELDEPAHAEGGLGERLVVEVMVAEHFQTKTTSRFIPEIGPVPTVSGEAWQVAVPWVDKAMTPAAAAASVPLRILGVFGQTLDPLSGAAYYARAIAVATMDGTAPAGARAPVPTPAELALKRWRQGSLLVRVRVGRRAVAALDRRPDGKALRDIEADTWSAGAWIELPPPSDMFLGWRIARELRLSVDQDMIVIQAMDKQGAWLKADATTIDRKDLGARPHACLVLTGAVVDARGAFAGERFRRARFYSAGDALPDFPRTGMNGPTSGWWLYVYWIECNPETESSIGGLEDNDLLNALFGATANEAEDAAAAAAAAGNSAPAMGTPDDDAPARIVAISEAIRGVE